MITDLQMYKALRALKDNPNFNEDYKIHVKKVGDIYSKPVSISSPKKSKPEVQLKTITEKFPAP